MDHSDIREPLPTMDFPHDAPKQDEGQFSSRVQTRFDNLVKSAFIKSLLATILAEIPIAWFIAVFLGGAGLKTLKDATRISEDYDLKTGGLYTASKVLGYVGLILGAYNSISYILSLVLSMLIIVMYFIFVIFVFAASGMAYM